MEDIERLEKAIKQAAASIWIDKLPLSKEFVENYKEERINEIKNNNSQRLILKRGGMNAKNVR